MYEILYKAGSFSIHTMLFGLLLYACVLKLADVFIPDEKVGIGRLEGSLDTNGRKKLAYIYNYALAKIIF